MLELPLRLPTPGPVLQSDNRKAQNHMLRGFQLMGGAGIEPANSCLQGRLWSGELLRIPSSQGGFVAVRPVRDAAESRRFRAFSGDLGTKAAPSTHYDVARGGGYFDRLVDGRCPCVRR